MFQKTQNWSTYGGTITIYANVAYYGVYKRWYTWESESSGSSYAVKFTYKGSSWDDYKDVGRIDIGGFYFSSNGNQWTTALYLTLYINRITGSNNNYKTNYSTDWGTGPINGKTYTFEIIR